MMLGMIFCCPRKTCEPSEEYLENLQKTIGLIGRGQQEPPCTAKVNSSVTESNPEWNTDSSLVDMPDPDTADTSCSAVRTFNSVCESLNLVL